MIFIFLILNIIYSFEIIVQSQNINICEKNQVQLYVLVNEANLNYKWFKDGVELTNENSPSLVFPQASFDDVGVYKCEISNQNQTIISKAIVLNVIPKTEVINRINNLNVFHNGNVDLFCELSDNSKNLKNKITWYDSQWNTIKDSKTIDGAYSNILSLMPDSTILHKYYCVVEGDCNSDTATYNLNYFNFKYPKSITTTICEDSTIKFDFDLVENKSRIIPKINKSTIINQKGIELNHNIIIENNILKISINDLMNADKTGKYKAILHFPGKIIEFNLLDLSIYLKTKLISKSDDYIELKAGQDLNLALNATGNIQEYEWYRNDSLVIKGKNPEFQKKQVTKNDAGIYTCKIINFCEQKTYFISEVNVTDNSTYLSVNDLKSNKLNIISIYDIQGREYYSISDLNNNKMYFILYNNDNDIILSKYIKYE